MKKMMKEQKSAHHQLGDHEEIVIEILSRLPVKSLTRFKCVCKHWQSLIQKDQFFIDLHFSRSKAAGTFSLIHVEMPYTTDDMRLVPVELALPSEEDGCVQVGYAREWKVWKPPSRFNHHVCTLDGLICLMDTRNNCARIENNSTRETTPWIKRPLIKEHFTYQQLTKHVFGYDPATKVYKVLAVWSLNDNGTDRVVCEVLTVRQNVWRRIEGIPSVSPPYTVTSSVYVNGSIYFLCDQEINDAYAETIVEFNVCSEKFTTVETLASYISFCDAPSTHLMESNGRLCLVIQDIQDGTYGSIKMSILYNHGEDVPDKKSKTTTNSSNTRMSTGSAAGSNNYRWGEETLSLPYYHTRLNSIRHIPGTNLFIIKSSGRNCHYIWNNKNNVIALDSIEMCSPLGGEIGMTEFDIFTPNLLRVN